MRRFINRSSLMVLFLALTACVRTTSTPTAVILPVETTPSSAPFPIITTAVPPRETLLTIQPKATAAPQNAILQTGVNLRTGPGMLFDIIDTFPQGQSVLVLGQAPAGDWYQVKTADSRTGWMRSAVLTLDGLAMNLPEILPTDVITIKGHVYTSSKNPASRVGVSLLEMDSNTSPQKDVGNTNAFGEWYIYLPASLAGQWALRVDSYSCKSNTVNSACTLIGQFPPAQTVTLPQAEGTWVDFEMLP